MQPGGSRTQPKNDRLISLEQFADFLLFLYYVQAIEDALDGTLTDQWQDVFSPFECELSKTIKT
jgi:hypothetical protein